MSKVKLITRSKDRYYRDEDGNVWKANKRFNSSDAERASDSLVDCNACVDCFSCRSCTGCVACSECDSCDSCTGCVYCKTLSSCYQCHNCSYSTALSECSDCLSCGGCVSCTDSTQLIGCVRCDRCKSSHACISSTDITYKKAPGCVGFVTCAVYHGSGLKSTPVLQMCSSGVMLQIDAHGNMAAAQSNSGSGDMRLNHRVCNALKNKNPDEWLDKETTETPWGNHQKMFDKLAPLFLIVYRTMKRLVCS